MTWIEALRELDPDAEVGPGVKMKDLQDIHLRPLADRVRFVQHEFGEPVEGVRARLDLFRPKDAQHEPGMLFVHGGWWYGLDPSLYYAQCSALAERGFVAASLRYRLGSEAPWPTQLDDVVGGIAWMKGHADEIGLDPSRVVLTGSSAGGHLAALAAFQRDIDVTTAILLYPGVDLATQAEEEYAAKWIGGLFGSLDQDALRSVDPLWTVSPSSPPILTLTGTADARATPERMKLLHERLEEAGVPNRLLIYEGREHGFDGLPPDWYDALELFTGVLEGTERPR